MGKYRRKYNNSIAIIFQNKYAKSRSFFDGGRKICFFLGFKSINNRLSYYGAGPTSEPSCAFSSLAPRTPSYVYLKTKPSPRAWGSSLSFSAYPCHNIQSLLTFLSDISRKVFLSSHRRFLGLLVASEVRCVRRYHITA